MRCPPVCSLCLQAALQDGYPLVLISTASLEDLNRRLSKAATLPGKADSWWGAPAAGTPPPPLGADRFRPNLVVSGCEAYEEDSWKRVRIGKPLSASL